MVPPILALFDSFDSSIGKTDETVAKLPCLFKRNKNKQMKKKRESMFNETKNLRCEFRIKTKTITKQKTCTSLKIIINGCSMMGYYSTGRVVSV